MIRTRFLSRSLTLLFALSAALGTANADTFTGAFAADNSLFSRTFSSAANQTFTFYTTSYAGGINADGSITPAGGFDPVLTLFSSTGIVLGYSGGDATCHGASKADPSTKLCEDASFSKTLAAGTYSLYLSEFPNVALGKLPDGFLAGSDAHFTGTNCNKPTGTFLQADLAPCVQRTANYSVNIVSPVPEPPTWLLIGPCALAIGIFASRRQLA